MLLVARLKLALRLMIRALPSTYGKESQSDAILHNKDLHTPFIAEFRPL